MTGASSDELDTASERAAAVSWRIAHGWEPTTRDVATLTGLSMAGAWRLMMRLSRAIPLHLDTQTKRWHDFTRRN